MAYGDERCAVTLWAYAVSEKVPTQQRVAKAIKLAEECGVRTDRVFLSAGAIVTVPLEVDVITSRAVPHSQVWFGRDVALGGAAIDGDAQFQLPAERGVNSIEARSSVVLSQEGCLGASQDVFH